LSRGTDVLSAPEAAPPDAVPPEVGVVAPVPVDPADVGLNPTLEEEMQEGSPEVVSWVNQALGSLVARAS